MSFYEQQGTSAAGTNHRRTWNNADYAQLAAQRAVLEEAEKKEAKVKRDLLKARDYKVDLESKIGRSVVINKATPSAESGGYYCDVCDCSVKDSINFLDHINGKNHQRNMGMNMKVKRSTLDDVKSRFEFKKREMILKKKETEIEETLEELKEEEARMTDYKKSKSGERKRKHEEEEEEKDGELDPEMAAMMGFGGFGSSKKK